MDEKILLTGGSWRPRALLLAQLQEDGYDVTAVETWDEAELLLRKRAVAPALVIFDLEDEPQADVALATLAGLVDRSRVVVLTAASTYPVDSIRQYGFEHVLARPYSVGDVVAAVHGVLR